MRYPPVWLAFGLLIPAPVVAGSLTLKITGLDSHIEDSVRANITLAHYLERDISASQVRRLLASADDEIREALEPFGYYSPQVTHHLATKGDDFETEFRVTPGEPVRVTDVRLEISDEAAQVPSVARVVKNFAPARGAQLDHEKYERGKEAILDALTGAGFLTARIRDHRVEVQRKAYSATIHLSWDCGTRYRFGPVTFSPSPLSEETLDRLVAWQEGDFFAIEKLQEFRRRLSDADYFSSVSVEPRVDRAENERVPVDVELRPANRDIYGGGVFVSTDTGPGVKAFIQRRWLNRSGHKLQLDGEYATRLQDVSIGYRIPFAGPNERAVSLGLTYKDETTDTSIERTTKLAWRETRKWRGLSRTLGLQLIGGDFEVGSERGNSNELFAEFVLDRTRTDDVAFTHQGYRATTSLKVAPDDVISRTRFVAVEGRAKWITSDGQHGRVILRSDVGAMVVDDFNALPPELRFFAGGDRSIRGFDYEALGSRNDVGDVIGGTYLTVVSAEYEYYFLERWGAAVFVDAGDAFLRDEFEWNIGAGLGIRWKTRVGAIRLDVGMPVKTALEKTVRVHVMIGPDL